MAVSYNKLWKLLVDKKMSKSDLCKKAEIAPNTMTKQSNKNIIRGIAERIWQRIFGRNIKNALRGCTR